MKFYITLTQQVFSEIEKFKWQIYAREKQLKKDLKEHGKAIINKFYPEAHISDFGVRYLYFIDGIPDYIEMYNINLGNFSAVITDEFNIEFDVWESQYYRDKLLEYLKNKYVVVRITPVCHLGGQGVDVGILRNRYDDHKTAKMIDITNYDGW